MTTDGPVAIERCLSLLALLLNERLTTREIAEALPGSYGGLTESSSTGRARKNFDKDKKLLQRLGYEVREEIVPRKGGTITLYWVDAAASLANLRFTSAQAIALTRLVQYMWLGSEVQDELTDAVDADVDEDDAPLRVTAPPSLAAVWHAQLSRRPIEFSQAGASRQLSSVVLTYDDQWLVSGWDSTSDEFRTFPLLGVEDVKLKARDTNATGERRPVRGNESLDVPVDPPCTAELAIADGHLAEAMDTLRSPGSEPKLLHGTLRVTVRNREAFLRALLQLGPHAVVLRPADLREQLIERLHAWKDRHGVA